MKTNRPRAEVQRDQVILHYGAEEIALDADEAWDLGDDLCLAAEKVRARVVNARASQARGEASDA